MTTHEKIKHIYEKLINIRDREVELLFDRTLLEQESQSTLGATLDEVEFYVDRLNRLNKEFQQTAFNQLTTQK